MARIAGVDIPREKRLEISLTYIFGIGLPTAQKLCANLGLDPNTKVSALTDDEVLKIGVAWGRRQVEELLARGVPSLHFYVMQSAGPVKQLMKDLR